MNVLYASAEVAPYAKTGGLADVAGSLPAALRAQGQDARVVMPRYGLLDATRFGIEPRFAFRFPHMSGPLEVQVFGAEHRGTPHYFLECAPWFGEEHRLYLGDESDIPRFVLFSQLTLALAWELRQRENWFPDILHANDWHCALMPFLLAISRARPGWAAIRSLLTLHNLAYQGGHAGPTLYHFGIPARQQPDLVYQDLGDNLLAIGIAHADTLTTVSPRHTQEIQEAGHGQGLDGLLRTRATDLHGILNGIDVARHDPRTDPHLAANFDVTSVATARGENRRALQAECGLAEDARRPLVGLVSRLEWHKGIDLALSALHSLLEEEALQFVGLGSGDMQLEHGLKDLAWRWPEHAAVRIGFDEALAQRIYAACDLFLMPSRFEPGGIGQLLAMRYGALPLVRATGGLADTVENYDDGRGRRGTGFVFHDATAGALRNTLDWALYTRRRRPATWRRMQERAMRRDFSLTRGAAACIDLYHQLAAREATWM